MSQLDTPAKVEKDGDWTIITLSPSSLDLFQSCELAYYYGKRRHLKSVEKSSALDQGSIFHKLLEKHYNLIIEGALSYQEVVLKVRDGLELLLINESDLEPAFASEISRVYLKYAQFYADDRLKPVAAEAPFSYLLYEGDGLKIILEGRIDLVVETTNQEEIVIDHKTADRQNQYTSLANQPRVYSLVTGIKTVQINEIGFQKEPIFRRVNLFYTENSWNEYREIIKGWVSKLLSCIEEDKWLANPSSCKYCNFRQICESDDSARDFKIQAFFKRSNEFDVFKGK